MSQESRWSFISASNLKRNQRHVDFFFYTMCMRRKYNKSGIQHIWMVYLHICALKQRPSYNKFIERGPQLIMHSKDGQSDIENYDFTFNTSLRSGIEKLEKFSLTR